MLTGKLLLVGIAALIAGFTAVVNAIWGPRAKARRRLMMGVTPIADHQVVTLVGKVRPVGDRVLTAPLSGVSCVAYEAVGRVYEGSGHNKTLVRELTERRLTAFELETAEGVVTVEGDDPVFALPTLPLIPRKLERERAFLAEQGLPLELAAAGTFEELSVRSGDRIFVQGLALVELATDSTTERGYRDVPQRVRLVAHADHPITIGRG